MKLFKKRRAKKNVPLKSSKIEFERSYFDLRKISLKD